MLPTPGTSNILNELDSDIRRGNLDVVSNLIGNNPLPEGGYSLLCTAIEHKQRGIAKLLMSKDVRVNNDKFQNRTNTPLHLAVMNCDIEIVRMLFKLSGLKANVNAEDEDGKTILYLAVERKDSPMVDEILSHCPDIDNISNRNSLRIAVYGCQKSYNRIIESLLDYGFRFGPEDATDSKLLHAAIEKGYLTIVQNLLVHVRADDRLELFSIAVKTRSKEMIKLLLEQSYDNAIANIGNSFLNETVDNDDVNLCTTTKSSKFLLAKRATVNTKIGTALREELHLAIQNGHKDVVQILLELGANLENENGESALHIAIKKNDVRIIKDLLEQGASVHSANPCMNGYTPLHMACENGLNEIAELLVSKGADVNVVAERKITPVYLAVRSCNYKLTRLLLKHKANVDTKDENGKTILHLAVEQGDLVTVFEILSCHPDRDNKSNKNSLKVAVTKHPKIFGYIAEYLIHYGFTVDCKSPYYYKFLPFVVKMHSRTVSNSEFRCLPRPEEIILRSGLIEIKNMILGKHFPDKDFEEYENPPVSHIAWPNDEFVPSDEIISIVKDFVKLLLKEGHSLNSSVVHEIFKIVRNINVYVDILDMLVKLSADVNFKSGQTLLHFVAAGGIDDICRLLIERGLDLNVKDRRGFTPLHLAIENGQKDVTRILLEHGADVNLKDKSDTTLLHLAVQKGHREICRLLIKYGADLYVKTNKGFMALHLAALHGFACVIKVLLDSGIDVDSLDKNGNTPLYIAIIMGNTRATIALLENGADVDHVNEYGEIPFDVAINPELNLSVVRPRNNTDQVKTMHDYYTSNKWDTDFSRLYHTCDYHYYSSCRNCDYMIDIIKRYQIKRQIANLDVITGKSNITANINSQPQFARKCKEEISRMKSTQINYTNATFYDILKRPTDQIAVYARNKNAVQAWELSNYRKEFPEYAGMIKSCLNKGMKRKELLDEGDKYFRAHFYEYYDSLPRICVEMILNYLSNTDLMTLKERNAFLRPH